MSVAALWRGCGLCPQANRYPQNEGLMPNGIPGNVLIPVLVSFLTDVSSDMARLFRPLLPATVPGAGPALRGFIAGFIALAQELAGVASPMPTLEPPPRRGSAA